MSLSFRFKISGVETANEPIGFDAFTIKIRRSDAVLGMVYDYDNKFTFWGSDYDTIFALIDNNTPNAQLTFSIEYSEDGVTYDDLVSGIISATDCSFNPFKRLASVTVEDRTYSAKIYNNKDYPVVTNQTTTKDGSAITAPTSYTKIYASATQIMGYSYLYDDLIDYVVGVITDNEIDVVDNWYPTRPDYGSNSTVYTISSMGSIPFNVTFHNLWVQMAKIHNLRFNLVYVSGVRKFVIDQESGYNSSTTAFTLSGVDTSIELSIDQSKVYGFVEVGDIGTTIPNEGVRFLYTPGTATGDNAIGTYFAIGQNINNSFRKYKYKISGSSSAINENTLRLHIEAGIAFNFIEAPVKDGAVRISVMIPASGNPYGDYQPANGVLDEPHTALLAEPMLSVGDNVARPVERTVDNTTLTNDSILSNYTFFDDVVVDDGDVVNTTRVELDGDYTIDSTDSSEYPMVVPFLNNIGTGSDTQSFWDNDLGRYQTRAFSVGSSKYSVEWSVAVDDVGGVVGGAVIKVWIQIEVDGNIGKRYVGQISRTTSTTYTGSYDFEAASENVFASVVLTYDSGDLDTGYEYEILDTSYIIITDETTKQRTVVSGDPTNAMIYMVDFKSTVPLSDFLTLYKDTRKNINLEIETGSSIKGWISEVSYRPSTGSIEGKLITNKSNISL